MIAENASVRNTAEPVLVSGSSSPNDSLFALFFSHPSSPSAEGEGGSFIFRTTFSVSSKETPSIFLPQSSRFGRSKIDPKLGTVCSSEPAYATPLLEAILACPKKVLPIVFRRTTKAIVKRRSIEDAQEKGKRLLSKKCTREVRKRETHSTRIAKWV